MWIDEKDGKVYQTVDVLDTPMGRIVDCLLRAKSQVGMSTRAEGDLEEAEDDRGKFQRVIPEAYQYKTTDFTADPSTFNVAPMDVRRNVKETVEREMGKLKKGDKSLAMAILESVSVEESDITLADLVKGDRLHEGDTLVYGEIQATVKSIDETNISLSVEKDGATSDVEVHGDTVVGIDPEGIVSVVPVAMEPEMSDGLPGERPDMSDEEPMVGDEEPMVGDEELMGDEEPILGDAEMPEEEPALSDEEGVEGDVDVDADIDDEDDGDWKKENESTEDVPTKHQLKIAKDTLRMSDAGAHVAGGMNKEEARAFLKKQGWSEEKIAKLEEKVEQTPGAGVKDNEGPVSDVAETVREVTELKIKEASVRAERDKAIEELHTLQHVNKANESYRKVRTKLMKRNEGLNAEVAGLRSVLETKANDTNESIAQLDEAKTKLDSIEKKLKGLDEDHVAEMDDKCNESFLEGKIAVLREYFDQRLRESRLKVHENVRALLGDCSTLIDVDELIERLTKAKRRSAIHSERVTEIAVRKQDPKVDEEQKRVDEEVGEIFEGFGFTSKE